MVVVGHLRTEVIERMYCYDDGRPHGISSGYDVCLPIRE
nr:MAG TPA: hypothetical protein [Caudoviricetes sp.]